MTAEVEKETFDAGERGKYKPRMRPNTPGRLKYGRTFLIGFAFLACSVAWAYYNFYMPLILHSFLLTILPTDIAYLTDFLVGIIMVLDNIVAIFFLPIFGALSDRTKSKHGKRMPYIIIGSISAMVAFSVQGYISRSLGIATFIGLILVIMWFNFSMAFFRSAAVTLMPDLTDPTVRSTGNGIINLMGGVSHVLALMVIPNVSKAIFGQAIADFYAGGFYLVSIVTLIGILILYLTIKETPTGLKFMEFGKYNIATDPITLEYLGEKKTAQKEPLLNSLRVVFKEKDHSALFMLLVIFIWFFGFNALNTFFSSYAKYSLGLEETAASSAVSFVSIAMILTAIFAGKIAEWIGRRITIMIGLIGLIITLIALYFVTSVTIMTVIFIFVGVFYGLININTIVLIWEMAPKGKIGSYTGVYYFFSQLSDILTPLAAGGMFSFYLWITGYSDGTQYWLLFPYAIVSELLAIFFLSRVKRGESEKYYQKRQAKK